MAAHHWSDKYSADARLNNKQRELKDSGRS